MTGPFSFRQAQPMPANPQPQSNPSPVATPPSSGGGDRFLEMLRANGVLGGGEPQAPRPPSPPMAFAPPPSRPPSNIQKPNIAPEPPAPPAKFTPGEPGQPKSGLTVHQLAKDEALSAAVDKWFASNKRKSIKGPDLMAMLKDRAGMEMSARQAAGLAKRLNAKREDPASGYMTKAAGKVMKE